MGYTNRHCLRLLRRYMVEIEDLVVKRSTTQAGSLSYTRNDKRQYSFDVTKREMSTSHDTTEYHRRMFQLREGRKITSSPRTMPSFSRWSSSQCARDHPRQNKCRSKNDVFDENGEMVGPPCWNCKYAINLIKDPFFCQSCEAIQPVSPKADVFSILGVDPKFEVEISALESKFRDLQKRLHPDKFTTSSVKEQQLSVEASSAVNKAYDILRKPLRRAKCLLQRYGLNMEEGRTIRDPELLEFVMEAREEVENAENQSELLELKQKIEERRNQCLDEITEGFRQQDNLEKVADAVTVLTYLIRIEEAIGEKL